ncbi:MAG: Calx-beta domain-containing protein [Acidimicrobiales bacterium]|nr:Calx-beta domain-containing protein [Acidimicrobiales bacterium]
MRGIHPRLVGRWPFAAVAVVLTAVITVVLAFANTPASAAACTINWDGGGVDDSWHTADNWDTNVVPGAADHVCIEPGAPVTVTYSSGTTSILSLQTNADGDLAVSGGSLTTTSTTDLSTLAGDLVVTLSADVHFAGAVEASGDVSLTGNAGASIVFSDTATVNSSGSNTVTLASSSTGAGFYGSGSLTMNVPFTYSQGEIFGLTITANDTVTFDGGSSQFEQGAILTLNGGTAAWTSGTIDMSGGSQIIVGDTTPTTLDITFDALLQDFGGTDPILETSPNGTIDIDTTGNVSIQAAVNHNGTLTLTDVDTLSWDRGGTTSSTVTIPSSSTLALSGTHTFTAASTIAGTGTIDFFGTTTIDTPTAQFTFTGDLHSAANSGATTIAADITVDDVSVTGSGDVFFNGALTATGDVSLTGSSSAAIVFGDTSSVAGTTTLAATTTGAGFYGPGPLTLNGPFTYSRGEIFSTAITANDTMTFDGGSSQLESGANLTLDGGTAAWTSGTIDMSGGSQIIVGDTTPTTLDITFDALLQDFGGTDPILETSPNGTIDIDTTGNVTIEAAVNHNGTLTLTDVDTLAWDRGGTTSSTVTIPSSSTLALSGTHTFTAASTIAGTGTIDFFGTTTIDTPTAQFTFTGDLHSAANSGATTIAADITVDDVSVTGSGDVFFNGALTATGDVSLTGSSSAAIVFGDTSSVAGTTTLAATTTGAGFYGPGPLTLNGPFTYSRGEIFSTAITANDTVTFDGNSSQFEQGAILTLDGGTATWTSGDIEMGTGAQLIVGDTTPTTLDITFDAFLQDIGGTDPILTISPNGTIDIDTTGDVVMQAFVNQSGTLTLTDVDTLSLELGGTTTSTVTVPATSTLELDGTHTFTAASTIAGTGTIEFFGTTTIDTPTGQFTFTGDLHSGAGGAATIAADITVDDITVTSNGDLILNGAVTVTGDVSLTGTSSAAIVFGDASTIAGTTTLAAATTGAGFYGSGPLTLNGAFIYSRGEIHSLAITANDTVTFDGNSSQFEQGAILTLDGGTATWTAGDIEMGTGSQLVVGDTTPTTLDITFDAFLQDLGGTDPILTISPNGTVDIDTTGDVLVQADIDHNGTLTLTDVDTLSWTSGGTTTSAVTIPATSTLLLDGNHTFTAASTIAGTGAIEFYGLTTIDTPTAQFTFNGDLHSGAGGAATIAADITIDDITVTSTGDLTFNGTVAATGDLSLTGTSGASIVFNGASTVAGTTTLAATTTSAGFYGAGTLALNGPFVFTQGEIFTLPVTANAAVTFDGTSSQLESSAILTLDGGTATWTSGDIEMRTGAQLIVGDTTPTTLDITFDAFLQDLGGTDPTLTISPNGTVDIDTTGDVLVQADIDHNGTLTLTDVDTLSWTSGGTTTSAVTIPATSTLLLDGNHTFTAASTIAGTGAIEFYGLTTIDTPTAQFTFNGDLHSGAGGAATIAADITIDDITVTSTGDLTFNGTVTATGDLSHTGTSGSAIIVNDDATIAGGTTLAAVTTSAGFYGSGSLALDGAFTFTQGEIFTLPVTANGAVTFDGAASQLESSAILTLDGGTATWTAGTMQMGTGAQLIVGDTTPTTLDITFDAFLQDLGGTDPTLTISPNGTVDIDTTGTVTFQGISVNQGTLAIGSDAVTTATNFTQSATGELRVEVVGTGGAGVDHGQVTGTVSLAGTLTVVPTGSYVPPSQTDFVIVSSAGVAGGDFATLADAVAGTTENSPATAVPPHSIDSAAHTWQVQYNPGVDVTLHTLTIWPVPDALGDPTQDEGTLVSYAGTFTDPDIAAFGDTHTFLWEVNPDNGDTVPNGTNQAFSFTPADNGTYTVTYTVTDSFGKEGVAVSTVTVTNLDPIISSTTNDGPVDEGTSATITVNASDVPADTLSYEFDCDNDATYEVGPQPGNTSPCSFPDDGANTVNVRVTDGDGGTATDTTVVTVNNLDPIISSTTNDGPVDEGTSATITVNASDVPADTLSYEFDCDNDATYEVGPQPGNTSPCSFPDDGANTVNVRVTDGDGGTATDSTVVSVTNLDPIISSTTNDGPVDEGTSATITVNASDVPADTLSYEFDCDNDATYEVGPQPGNTSPCSFPDDGANTVNVRVTDGDGGTATDTTVVTVNNLDPIISSTTNDGPVDEGTSATITVNASDVPADTLSYEFDCDNDATYEVGPQPGNTSPCSFPDDGANTVNVRVTDGDGGTATDTTVVTVNNLDPIISSTTNDGPVDEGTSATITVNASDVPADTLSYEFDCDNDATYEVGPQPGNTSPCSFADQGSHTVNVRVTDGDGGTATDSTVVSVTNLDPIISSTTNDGPVDEGTSATITVNASDVPADTLSYEFDCDNDATYEVGPQPGNTSPCSFPDDGANTVNVRVTDGDGGTATDSTVVTVFATPVITPGIVTIAEGDAGSTIASLPVTLSNQAATPVTVDFVTFGAGPGIATPGVDYTATSGTVTFLPGSTSETVEITIFGDLVDEPPALFGEWIPVAFSNPSANAAIDPSFFGVGIASIIDDDPPPTITPGYGSVLEGDAGSVFVDIPVTLSNPSAETITVDWTTFDNGGDGIATAGVDYAAASGTVTFVPGDTQEFVTIEVFGDLLDEPPALFGEWIVVSFSNASANASIDPTFFGLGIGSIIDDDP